MSIWDGKKMFLEVYKLSWVLILSIKMNGYSLGMKGSSDVFKIEGLVCVKVWYDELVYFFRRKCNFGWIISMEIV